MELPYNSLAVQTATSLDGVPPSQRPIITKNLISKELGCAIFSVVCWANTSPINLHVTQRSKHSKNSIMLRLKTSRPKP